MLEKRFKDRASWATQDDERAVAVFLILRTGRSPIEKVIEVGKSPMITIAAKALLGVETTPIDERCTCL